MVIQVDTYRNLTAHAVGKLSIIVPAFNEGDSVGVVIGSLLSMDFPVPFEVILIDDGSTDGSTKQFENQVRKTRFKLLKHEVNRGKGAAVLTGLSSATGTHCVIFDADDEYDPNDLIKMVLAFDRPRVKIVYGSRMHSGGTSHPSLIHYLGNNLMTAVANILFSSAITDLHTCLKMFPLEIIRTFKLTETGFGLDTEITAEMLRRGYRPFEVPISYNGRTRAQGKKIRFTDSLHFMMVILRVRFLRVG